jgi:hypothetical protein
VQLVFDANAPTSLFVKAGEALSEFAESQQKLRRENGLAYGAQVGLRFRDLQAGITMDDLSDGKTHHLPQRPGAICFLFTAKCRYTAEELARELEPYFGGLVQDLEINAHSWIELGRTARWPRTMRAEEG